MTEIDIRHFDHLAAAELRPLLLEVYAEIYAKDTENPAFTAVDRFAPGLDSWSSKPGWTCVVGYDSDGEAVGYAYGAPCPRGPAGGAGCSRRCPPTSPRRPAPARTRCPN